ncbi:hypothetical protein EV642_12162 [Kribbella sp. VKM Ac-2500]|uniref:hypothetical protein n=1 Tax=Kribbella sp. VKM Ac-2500 TaxID=2512214 RepID=UPI0010DCE1EF|nr:hypothetical protein [Kribbella sp. VKM Ac-2500]TCN34425.1 hypothetical protein EV642_12162 [Kribbella sp. VKM Ac-2500]
MQFTSLGSTGLKISRICLGMMSFGAAGAREWHLDEEAAEPIVRRAVEAGVTRRSAVPLPCGDRLKASAVSSWEG